MCVSVCVSVCVSAMNGEKGLLSSVISFGGKRSNERRIMSAIQATRASPFNSKREGKYQIENRKMAVGGWSFVVVPFFPLHCIATIIFD